MPGGRGNITPGQPHTSPDITKTGSQTRVHRCAPTLLSAQTQALFGGGLLGGACYSPHLWGPLPLPSSWGQALVEVKRLVDKHCVAVARSCDSARVVTPLKAVYTERHPVQEADRRGLAWLLLLFPAAF